MPSLPTVGQKPWDLNAWLLVGHDAAGNNLGAGPDANKVDKDSVVVAGTRVLANKLLAGDAQPTFRILGSGELDFGPGGATAPDVSFVRSAAAWMRLTGGLDVTQDIYARSTVAGWVGIGSVGPSSQPGIKFQNDTALYRLQAGYLATDGQLYLRGGVNSYLAMYGSADSAAKFYIDSAGGMAWGTGAVATDTSLSRTGVGILKTGGQFVATGKAGYVPAFLADGGGVGVAEHLMQFKKTLANFPVVIIDANGSIMFGPGDATNNTDSTLGRWGVNSLGVSGAFNVQTTLRVDNAGAGYALYLGSGNDVPLYRGGANTLTTSAQMVASGGFSTSIGSSAAAALYATALATDGYVVAAKQAGDTTGWRFLVSATGALIWGAGGAAATDTQLYRWAAGVLRIDNMFMTSSPGYFSANNGGATGSPAPGIEFGYTGANRQYRHSIKTAHNASDIPTNVMDFHLWTTADAAATLGTLRVLRLQGDGQVLAAAQVVAGYGTVNQVNVGWAAGAAPGIEFGNAGDTRIYRSAVGTLKTDGALVAVGAIDGDMFQYRGDWAAGSYQDGDVVVYNGVAYLCVRPTSAAPDPTQWQ